MAGVARSVTGRSGSPRTSEAAVQHQGDGDVQERTGAQKDAGLAHGAGHEADGGPGLDEAHDGPALDEAHDGPALDEADPSDHPGGSRAVGIAVSAVVIVATLALGAGLLLAMGPGDGLPADPAGEPLPTFDLPAVDDGGEPISSAAVEGEPTLVTFWASWCGTCAGEVPTLDHFARHDDRVEVVGIATEDTREAAQGFLDDHDPSYANVLDADGQVGSAFGVMGTPETFLVDAEGQIAEKWSGSLPRGQVERAIDHVAAES